MCIFSEGYISHDVYREIIPSAEGPCLIRDTYSPCVCCDPEQKASVEVTETLCMYFGAERCMYDA